ncbi:MAG: hypothetical protein R3322_00340 [Kiloniellales bacterium]|nr:hypothetical protein [Kiloniellales bacterium]
MPSVDPVTYFMAKKRELRLKRGYRPGVNSSSLIPRSTYRDVYDFYSSFIQKTYDPNINWGAPLQDAARAWAATLPGAGLLGRMGSFEYPANEDFWSKGAKFAIERSSANYPPPSGLTLAWESVSESASELADKAETLARGAGRGLELTTNLIKWGVYATFAYIVYQEWAKRRT